jgi:hypothetical protein
MLTDRGPAREQELVRGLQAAVHVTTRPSTKLFTVGDWTKPDKPAASAPRPNQPSVFDLDLDEDVAPGVTAEAWHKARGWASED